MQELFDLSFSPANIFPTILLLFVALYWLVFLFGMLDLSFMDFDLEADAEVDVDMDVDADAGMGKNVHVESGTDLSGQPASPGTGMQILQFLNLGDIPFMLFFSFFALFFWAMSILGNHYLSDGNLLFIIGLGFGSFFISLLLTKVVTQPFRKMFREMGKGDVHIDLRGKLCTLELGMEKDRLGQADAIVNGKHFLITVRSEDGSRIDSGTRCLIVDRAEKGEIYFVQPFVLDEDAL